MTFGCRESMNGIQTGLRSIPPASATAQKFCGAAEIRSLSDLSRAVNAATKVPGAWKEAQLVRSFFDLQWKKEGCYEQAYVKSWHEHSTFSKLFSPLWIKMHGKRQKKQIKVKWRFFEMIWKGSSTNLLHSVFFSVSKSTLTETHYINWLHICCLRPELLFYKSLERVCT